MQMYQLLFEIVVEMKYGKFNSTVRCYFALKLVMRQFLDTLALDYLEIPNRFVL